MKSISNSVHAFDLISYNILKANNPYHGGICSGTRGGTVVRRTEYSGSPYSSSVEPFVVIEGSEFCPRALTT